MRWNRPWVVVVLSVATLSTQTDPPTRAVALPMTVRAFRLGPGADLKKEREIVSSLREDPLDHPVGSEGFLDREVDAALPVVAYTDVEGQVGLRPLVHHQAHAHAAARRE